MGKKTSNVFISVLMAAMMLVSVKTTAFASEVVPFTDSLDYSRAENWLYDGVYSENEVGAFIIAPTVDVKSKANASLTPEFKNSFRYAMNQQQAIYANTARIYAPYYRQISINVYAMEDGADKEQAKNNAFMDVSAAFKYYLEHKNNGRPVILAGFSQGAEMCYRLLEEYYGGDGERAKSLRENLIAVYAIGWPMTQEMIDKYPQIVPAKGETDTGVVISYECEDGSVSESISIPRDKKSISINPLNWRTDSQKAAKSLNKGSVTQDRKTGAITSVEAGKYGAYIDPKKGTLIVTGINMNEYPKVLDIFPEGSLHLYDNFLFFVNLQENVQKRTKAFLEKAMDDAA